MGVVSPKNTSAKYTIPTSAVINPVLAGGISTAVTAISGTYSGVRSLWGPPVMCTTVVISATSNSACPYRNVRQALFDVALRSEEHTSELQSPCNLVCRLLLEKKKVTQRVALHASDAPTPVLGTRFNSTVLVSPSLSQRAMSLPE